MVCGFFGHKDTPNDIRPALEKVIRSIVEQNADVTFYVGNQGHFDSMVYTILKKYADGCPTISYYVVLAYLTNDKLSNEYYDSDHTVFPEGIESIMPKYAISYRNKWIANQADTIICYIKHGWGGAAQFVDYARKRGKVIINLAETENLSQNTGFCERHTNNILYYYIIYFIKNMCVLSR